MTKIFGNLNVSFLTTAFKRRLVTLNLNHNRIVEIRAHCFRLSRDMATLKVRDNDLGTLEGVSLRSSTFVDDFFFFFRLI